MDVSTGPYKPERQALGSQPFTWYKTIVRWKAKVALLGQDKTKDVDNFNGDFLCLPCPTATFALQHGGFVPREWLSAKDNNI